MNFIDETPQSYASITIIKSILFWFMSIFACMTILTHIAQITGITFKTYAYTGLFFMLAISLLIGYFFREQYSRVTQYDRGTLLLLAAMSLGGAFIATFFHTIRSGGLVNYDLFYYVPNAVYHLQNPDSPMEFIIHFIEAGSEPLSSYFLTVSLPFEYTQAIIAYFFNTHYLSIYFIVSSALLGSLIPLALYYLIAQFINPRSAAVGTLFTVAIILLLGETPRTPGTWSFINVYIGKVFFLSIGIPLFAAATINFFRTSSLFDWLFTFAVTTAMVGATSTSMVLLPALTAVLIIALAAVSDNYKKFLSTSLTYISSLSYLILYILIISLNLHSNLTPDSPISEDFPVTFWGHAAFLFEKSGPATPLALIGSTIFSILMTSGMVRKFIIAWIVAAIVLFLNPIVAPFLIKHVTTPTIYWRMFYIYPLPLLLGLTGAKLFEYTAKFSKPTRLALISGTAFMLFISHFVPFTTSVLYLRTEFGWPRYKIPLKFEKLASGVIAVTPPGPMLAPLPLGGIIAMLSANYPQMRVFNEPERVWFGERGMRSEIDKRICASDFVGGDKPDCLSAFKAVLEYSNLRSVVIAKSVALDPQVQGILDENGFIYHKDVNELVAYWK